MGKTTQVARLSTALDRARHRARGDARTRRHAAGREHPRCRADARATRHCRRPRNCCSCSRRARCISQIYIEPNLARGPVGDLRSLHRRDLRLSRRRPRLEQSSRSAQLERLVQGTRRPDLTVLLDVPVAAGLGSAPRRAMPASRRRIASNASASEFFERVRAAYLRARGGGARAHRA